MDQAIEGPCSFDFSEVAREKSQWITPSDKCEFGKVKVTCEILGRKRMKGERKTNNQVTK